MRAANLAAGLLLAAAATACTSPGAHSVGLTVRDSAGIEILESSGGPAERWRLADEPELELGTDEGDDLYQVRGAARLSDGRIAVANGGSSSIRLYGGDGRLFATAGGAGGGPGEFGLLAGFAAGVGDALVAFDPVASRLSHFDADGGYVRSTRLEAVGGYTPPMSPVGSPGAGTFVVRARKTGDLALPSGTVTERTEEALILYGADGEIRAVLGPFRGPERILQVGPAAANSFSIRSVPVPFQKELHADAAGGWIAVGSTERYELRLYTADGELRRIVREAREPRKVTPGDLDAWVAARTGAEPGSAAFRERRREFDRVQLPQTLPAFQSMRLDDAGRLWVREFEPASTAEARWRVFDPRARRLAEVVMPSSFRPLHIGTDHVLGVWTDEVGVERVRLYRIRRGRDASS